MNETITPTKQALLNTETAYNLLKIVATLSPTALMILFAKFWVWKVENPDPKIMFYFIIAGIVTTILMIIHDIICSRSDFVMFLDIHNTLEPIDRDAQAEIHAGLQDMIFFDESMYMSENNLSSLDRLMFRTINDLAIDALIPSAYHNHHGKELVEFGSEAYFERKRKIVHRAFSIAPSHYKQFVIDRLGEDITFDKLVDNFIKQWIINEVIPATRKACQRKIIYYTNLCLTRGISRGFRSKIMEWKKKNENYLGKFAQLLKTI